MRARVMKTLIAPTVMVLTGVLVSKDLLEMEHLVMVRQTISNFFLHKMLQVTIPLFY